MTACNPPIPDAPPYPSLLVPGDRREAIRDRVDDEPFAELLAQVEDRAGQDYLPPDDVWSAHVNGTNASIAESAAFLAWLNDDEAMATKAREGLGELATDWDTNDDWDVNIRMVRPIQGYANTLDLLRSTPWLPDEERLAAEERLGLVTAAFFAKYVENDVIRGLVLGPAQNNHPIRTASAVGYAALALPEHPDSAEWLNFAASEVEYLLGPDGKYLQPDGSVSEGPFYYGFGLSAAIPFLIAMDEVAADRQLSRDCRNRQDVAPWTGHGCVDGEAFTFDNPLHGDLLYATIDWWVGIRVPNGESPPLEDAYFNGLNGGALLTGFRPEGRWRWSWEDSEFHARSVNHGNELQIAHLAWMDPTVAPVEPDWTTRFFVEGGHGVLRSDWSRDARWLLVTAEAGPARMTLHDHVDGTSFQMAAYGEYLLLDPGYYKPNELDNAVTSGPESHNVVLIDGKGAPEKGLLTDFGDTDASLGHTHDGALVDWVDAEIAYEDTAIRRSIAMVRNRWFFVADRLITERTDARTHQWRLGGNAGYDAGGSFTLIEDGARFERTRAGVEVRIAATDAGLAVAEPPLSEGDAPHVHEFDEVRNIGEHAVIDGTVTGVAPDFLSVLAPWKVGGTGDEAPLTVVREPVDGAVAWRVSAPSFEDVVILTDGGTSFTLSDGTVVETDAAVAVFAVAGAPLAAMLDGTYLRVDGEDVAAGSGLVVAE